MLYATTWFITYIDLTLITEIRNWPVYLKALWNARVQRSPFIHISNSFPSWFKYLIIAQTFPKYLSQSGASQILFGFTSKFCFLYLHVLSYGNSISRKRRSLCHLTKHKECVISISSETLTLHGQIPIIFLAAFTLVSKEDKPFHSSACFLFWFCLFLSTGLCNLYDFTRCFFFYFYHGIFMVFLLLCNNRFPLQILSPNK